MAVTLNELAEIAAKARASDIFIKAGAPPNMRLHGMVTLLGDYPVMDNDEVKEMIYGMMTPEQIHHFEDFLEFDFAFQIEGLARFRVNIYQQRGTLGGVLRIIPLEIYSLEDLSMPKLVYDLSNERHGFVLVTGPTGSGKSTTMAAMIDLINQSRRCNIITVEEPIEFVHPDKQAIVNQREVGIDTHSFTNALKYVLRQAPDVILIGEMRDVETMNVALGAAETGHLVFSTVHTRSAAETLERIVNMYPPSDRQMLCMRLASTMRGIVSQKLIPRIDKPGRIASVEVMYSNPTIAKLLEEGRSGQIYQAILEGGFWGMQTMNQCLDKYVKAGLISIEEALANAGNETELRQMMRRK